MLSKSPNSLQGSSVRHLISAALVGILGLSGCRKTNTHQPENTEPKIHVFDNHGKIDPENNCRTSLLEVIKLGKKAARLNGEYGETIERIEILKTTFGLEDGEEVRGLKSRRDEMEIESGQNALKNSDLLAHINGCQFEEVALKKWLLKLNQKDLIDLIRAINEGKKRMVLSFKEGTEHQEGELDKEQANFIINIAFEALFNKGIPEENLEEFFSLMHLAVRISNMGPHPFLSKQNQLEFKRIFFEHLKKKFAETKDLGTRDIDLLPEFGEEGWKILFDFTKNTEDTEKLREAILTLKNASRGNEKQVEVKNFFLGLISDPTINENKKALILEEMAEMNPKFSFFDEKSVPFLIDMIRTGPIPLSQAAVYGVYEMNQLGFVDYQEIRETASFLIKRAKKAHNSKDGCRDLKLALAIDENSASFETIQLHKKLCES